ncbi:phage major capsid protein [Gordonia otitidis]|uniref:phage major capsid protein n=1 Tax=Gordonia otitidis TaxID=249058 RepID=UPI001D1387AD|nr:phage major capsid protein [Gordonia otitidis]UEA58382.1 phage major capsid protein [Gordonia otitidis]
MALTNTRTGAGYTQAAGAFTPEDFGGLVDVAVKTDSVLARTFTTTSTDKDSVRYPKLISFPDVGHYKELDTVALADPTTGEVVVPIYRTAGAHKSSRELSADSAPDTADMVAKVLVNQIVRSVDAAGLGNTTSNGPSGLLSTAYSSVDVSSITNLDPFIDAIYTAEAQEGSITSWIMKPATAQAILKLKKATGSAESLISFTESGDLSICGRPVVVSPQVDANTLAWGISGAHNVLVNRIGTTVERSKEANFLDYALVIMATYRYGIGFLHPAANVRIFDAP